MPLRVVADTNVIVSAVLWEGIPGKLIAAARDLEIQLFTSQALLDELADVIHRKKLAKRWRAPGKQLNKSCATIDGSPIESLRVR